MELGKHKREENNDREIELKKIALSALEKEKEELDNQRGRLFDFLERGIYSDEVFLERSQALSNRMEENKASIIKAQEELQETMSKENKKNNIIPMIQNVIKLYERTKDPVKKNALLKSVLVKVEYRKEKHQRNDDFEIKLFPRV